MGRRLEDSAAANGEAAGWVVWAGGECPVDEYANVNWRTADPDWHQNDNAVSVAKALDWRKLGEESDIIAYRVVPA